MIKLILEPWVSGDFVGKAVPLYNWCREGNNWHQVIYHRKETKSGIMEEWAGGRVDYATKTKE